jgi:hypothetical protein
MAWIVSMKGQGSLFIIKINLPVRSSLSSNVVRALYEDRKGTLWIGTGFPFDKEKPNDGGLNRMEPNGTVTRFMHDPNNPHSLINK